MSEVNSSRLSAVSEFASAARPKHWIIEPSQLNSSLRGVGSGMLATIRWVQGTANAPADPSRNWRRLVPISDCLRFGVI